MTNSSLIILRMTSSSTSSIFDTSCEVRNPSKKCRNGIRLSSVAAWAISAKSIASCTLAELSMANPVVRASITSLWSPKMDSACVASVRAEMWNTVGVSSPAIFNILGTLSSKPWDAVNVQVSAPVWSAPCTAPAAPAFALHLHHRGDGAPEVLDPFRGPLVAPLAHVRGGGDGINPHHFVAPVGHVSHRFIAVNCRIGFVHFAKALNR